MQGTASNKEVWLVLICLITIASGRGCEGISLPDGLVALLRSSTSFADNFGSGTLGQIWRFIEAQIFAAPIDAIVPTLWLLRPTPSIDFYKLTLCPRADVYKCLYYGNSSNGLPPQLHGVWWQDGIDFDEVAISPVGHWNPNTKVLRIDPYKTSNWAGRGTGSELDPGGLYFRPSGAAHLNFLAWSGGGAIIQFNDDVTFGQIYGASVIFGIPIIIPKFIIDWTMTLQPNGDWVRKSRTFGLPEPDGDYVLRSIVTGDGKPGPAYSDWVKDRERQPFLYLQKIFPSD